MRHVLPKRRSAHPREASLATITIVGGLIALVCGAVHPTHFVAVCVGVVTVLFGFYSQLVSATTGERWINVIGIGMGFIGLGLGLSHGGFTL
jgi:pantothenate synthetase